MQLRKAPLLCAVLLSIPRADSREHVSGTYPTFVHTCLLHCLKTATSTQSFEDNGKLDVWYGEQPAWGWKWPPGRAKPAIDTRNCWADKLNTEGTKNIANEILPHCYLLRRWYFRGSGLVSDCHFRTALWRKSPTKGYTGDAIVFIYNRRADYSHMFRTCSLLCVWFIIIWLFMVW